MGSRKAGPKDSSEPQSYASCHLPCHAVSFSGLLSQFPLYSDPAYELFLPISSFSIPLSSLYPPILASLLSPQKFFSFLFNPWQWSPNNFSQQPTAFLTENHTSPSLHLEWKMLWMPLHRWFCRSCSLREQPGHGLVDKYFESFFPDDSTSTSHPLSSTCHSKANSFAHLADCPFSVPAAFQFNGISLWAWVVYFRPGKYTP